MIKKCRWCKKEFEITEQEKRFCSQICRNKNTICQNKANKKYKSEHKKETEKYNKIYKQNHKEQTKIYNKKYREENKEKLKQNRQNSNHKSDKKYKKSHREQINQYNRKYFQNPINKIIAYCRTRMNSVLKRNSKTGHTIELIGCSTIFLKKYIENQFTLGMSWSNYGKYGWHLDHIIPLSSFDFENHPEQQKTAFHYSNLQPLWAEDNLKKGDKI